MAKRQSRAVARNSANHMAVTEDRPDFLDENSNRGSEEVNVQDLAIPRIAIIQDLSPQRKKDKPEYIDGAEEGLIFNTVTNALYGDSVVVVPVLFRKEFVIWKDRDSGGGYRGAYPTEGDAAAALADLEDGDQCEVVDTAQHFCLILTDDGVEEAVISMSKSQMKVSRNLNSMIRLAGGDRFSRAYEFSTVSIDGPKGDYYNWKPKALGYVSKEIFERAEGLYEAVRRGERDVDRTDHRPNAAATDEDDAGY